MGEKRNLLDTSEEVFANLVEQGPQFWIAYEQYKQARIGNAPEHVDAEPDHPPDHHHAGD